MFMLYKYIKVKIVPVHNETPRYEGVMESGGVAPRIPNLDIRWR